MSLFTFCKFRLTLPLSKKSFWISKLDLEKKCNLVEFFEDKKYEEINNLTELFDIHFYEFYKD